MNILQPRIICISNEMKDDYFSTFIKNNQLYYDERDIIIIKENMIERSLIKALYKGYCYYYQIGDDEISIPKISLFNNEQNHSNNDINILSNNNPNLEENNDNQEYFVKSNYLINFFVIGRPGAGKSSLINFLLNDKRAKEGVGCNITTKISKYILWIMLILHFMITPGFSGEKEIKLTKYKIKEKIQNYMNIEIISME